MTARLIDSDVHIAAPDVEQLSPFLTAQWRDYVRENGFRRSTAVGHTFPNWEPAMAVTEDETSLARLRATVLQSAERILLNCYAGLEPILNIYFASALATALNDWLRHEWLDKEPRLLAGIIVPIQDPDAAAAEIIRLAAEPRFVQVLLPVRSWEPYGKKRFAPIWRAAADTGVAIAIHYGGLTGNPTSAVGWMDTHFQKYAASPQMFQAQLASLIGEGVFESYPSVRVVLLESGVSWLPPLLWKLDQSWKYLRREVPWLKQLPSEYTRSHVRLTTEPMDTASVEVTAEIVQQIGADDILMYGSDHPHPRTPESDFVWGALTVAQAERVRWNNAWDCYRLGTLRPTEASE